MSAANDITTFSYVAVSYEGDRKKGRMDAMSAHEVAAALQAEGLIPLEVEEFRATLANINITTPKEDRPIRLGPPEVVTFARQLFLLIRAGLALPRSLEVLGEDADDVRFTKMCSDLSSKVISGVPLSKAMEAYPGSFDEIFRAYVAAGEVTGNMEESLSRLSRMLDKSNQLRLKIKAVTAYPKMVSYAIFAIVVGILLFLVPAFAKIYADMGAQLPLPTRILVFVSSILSPIHVEFRLGLPPVWVQDGRNLLTSPINFLSPTMWVMAAWFGFRRWRRSRIDDVELGMLFEKIKFGVPVLGKLWKYQVLYRWSSTMSGAIASGLSTYVALDLAGRTSGSFWVQHVSEELKEAVRVGRPLSSEMAKHKDLFSPQLRAMAATGEEAGEPAEMFNNVALTLEDELEAMVAVLGARLEVFLLIFMGAVVGGLVVVLYLPIFNLSNAAMDGYGQSIDGSELDAGG